jgi:uncharacterized protein
MKQTNSSFSQDLQGAEQRRTNRAEVLLVLGVSLGYSAIYAMVDLAGKLTAHKALSSQTTTLNASQASGRAFSSASNA